MTNQSSFERAYDTLRADPSWQTALHAPITNVGDVWDRFLVWLSHVDFSGLATYLLIRIILFATIAWLGHKIHKRWCFSTGDWRRRTFWPRLYKCPPPTRAEVPEEPTDPGSLAAEADRLARSGYFLEAISVLFKASIAAADHWTARPIEVAATVREIAEKNMPSAARDALCVVGRALERGRFAGASIEAAIYHECRQACEGLIDGRSWRE